MKRLVLVSLLMALVSLSLAACSSSPGPSLDAKSDARLDGKLDGKPDGAGRDAHGGVDAGRLTLRVVDSCAFPSAPADGTINTEGDVAYGDAGRTLDIAWPKGTGPFPLVVLIHGGGWSSGDKSELGVYADLLAGAGYVAATINYRLAKNPENLYPACIEDARCAVRWLRDQASRYAIDTSRVVVAGPSAGGNLALMLAVADSVAGLDGGDCSAASQPVRVSGVISFYGATDLRATANLGPTEKDTLQNLFGDPPEQATALAALASRIVHVTASAPPVLMIHGTADDVVPIAHSRNLKAALDKVGATSLLLEVSGEGHDFPLLSGTAPYLRHSCTALAYLETILR